MKKETHADKFARQCRESNLAHEKRQIIDSHGNDKISLAADLDLWGNPVTKIKPDLNQLNMELN